MSTTPAIAELAVEEGGRKDARITKIAVDMIGFVTAVIGILWSADVLVTLGVPIYQEQVLAFMLGLAFALTFLWFPMAKDAGAPGVPAYDVALAAIAIVTCTWLAIRYPALSRTPMAYQMESIAFGAIIIPLLIEGTRRSNGLSLAWVLGAFILYALFGNHLPGQLQARTVDPMRLFSFMSTDSSTLLAEPLAIVSTIVVLFIFMGRLLEKTGASNWFTDLAVAMMGRTRGGSGKIAVVSSLLFGSISGSAVANVVATGVVSIPMMRRAGYSRTTAAGIEAVASTGGQIMPPVMGAAAFIMGEFMQLPYSAVLIAAIIPGLLFYIALFIQTDLEAAKNAIRAVPEDQIPKMGKVLAEGWFFVIPFVVLIYAMFGMLKRVESAALYACAALVLVSLVFSYRGKRISFRETIQAAVDTGRDSASIILIGALAGIIIGLIDYTGLSFALGFILVTFGDGNIYLLLAMTAIISLLLGLGMPTTAIYFLLATLIVPTLIKLGIEPMGAHMFVLYYGVLSMISPPVAMASFAAANLAGARPMETAWLSCKLGWSAFVVPFLFVLNPNLLMIGRPFDIVVSVIAATAGIYFVCAAVIGYGLSRLSLASRLLAFAIGALLMIPVPAIPYGQVLQIVGFVAGALFFSLEIARRAKARGPVEAPSA